ncbi:hypothetical protein ACLOJK_018378 [Asimina triloba]
MTRFRYEMGHDRSGMKLKLLMTGEEDSPRVASVINVSLRSQQIWNARIVAVVMSGLDRGKDGPMMVGLDDWHGFVVFFTGDVWVEHGDGGQHRRNGRAKGFDRWLSRWRERLSPADGNGGSHVDDGAPKVLHVVGRRRMLPRAQFEDK